MYIPSNFEANRADIYKIMKISEEEKNQIEQQTDAKMKQKQLAQTGMTDN